MALRLNSVRSLASASAAKIGKQSLFTAKSIQYMRLESHKEPYNTAPWTRKRGMWQLAR